jgi:hypothetical protein
VNPPARSSATRSTPPSTCAVASRISDAAAGAAPGGDTSYGVGAGHSTRDASMSAQRNGHDDDVVVVAERLHPAAPDAAKASARTKNGGRARVTPAPASISP